MSPANNFTVKHHNSADGHLAQGIGFFSFRQGLTHISGVVHVLLL
ncbi:MAG: hypothetical protein RJR37_04500 [Peptococcaceae bacterium MAG4]|nr:hypothetical protein [Peptococcaceae bacterium MAG4]